MVHKVPAGRQCNLEAAACIYNSNMASQAYVVVGTNPM